MARRTVKQVDGNWRFGERMRELREQHRYSTKALAMAIAERLPGYSVTGEAVALWERKPPGPRRRGREVVEVIDDLLHADGELLNLAGYGPTVDTVGRLSAVELELRRQAQVLDEILARLPAPQGAG